MTKQLLLAATSAAFLATSAGAGNLISPAEEPEIEVFPEYEKSAIGSLPGSSAGDGTVVLGVLGLLLLGALSSGGGS